MLINDSTLQHLAKTKIQVLDGLILKLFQATSEITQCTANTEMEILLLYGARMFSQVTSIWVPCHPFYADLWCGCDYLLNS